MSVRLLRAPVSEWSLGGGLSLIRRLGDRPAILLDSEDLEALHGCVGLRTLEEHAHAVARARSRPLREIRRALQGLARRSLLLPEPDLVSTLRSAARGRSSGRIEAVAIPTRDRPQALARCLDWMARQGEARWRGRSLTVADDSSAANAARNQAVLARQPDWFARHLRYVGPDQRRAFAARLSRGGLPRDVVELGLFGSREVPFRPGANRNAILLDAAGELLLSVDDDVVFRFAPAPDRRASLAIEEPSAALYELWPFQTREAALAAVSFEDEDPFAIHEGLLGRSIHECAGDFLQRGGEIAWDTMKDDGLALLLRTGPAVAATMTGLVGDSGLEAHDHLFLRAAEPSRTRIFRSRRSYLRWTREVVRAPTRTVLSRRLFMAGQAGLDGRALLPPFLPAGRNEDGCFGALLATCCPDLLIGHLPWVVQHAPLRPRRRVRRMPPSMSMDAVIHIALQCRPLRGWPAEPEQRIRLLGEQLMTVGALPFADFDRLVADGVVSVLGSQIQLWMELLTGSDLRPGYWVAEIERVVDGLARAIERPQDFLLDGFAAGWGPARRRRAAQQLVMRYGHLLSIWPDLVSESRRLKAGGARLSRPVDGSFR